MEPIEPARFTCIGKGHGAPCLPATRADWERLRREPWLSDMCARIEKGQDELKHRLPVWTPSCAAFRNNHRAAADALQLLPRLMMDFDEKDHTDEIKTRLLEKSPLTVLLIEESVRRGTHVLVELPEGMTADTAQQLMREATGFEPDPVVKGAERCIYMVPESHTRYVSSRLDDISAPPTPSAAATHGQTAPEPATAEAEPPAAPCRKEFKGIPYADIIARYWRKTGGEPQEGERNVKLHKLAVNLRAICDNRREVLMQVMPRFGLTNAELQSVVDSACKEEPKDISKLMQQVVDEELQRKESDDYAAAHPELDDAPPTSSSAAATVPASLRKSLPIGLRESLVGVPPSMHMPVLCGVLPIAAAYADMVEVEYCDGNRQHLGLMSIIRGEQASNKSVVKNAVDVWKRQLDEEDAQARRLEEKWKERRKARKANEKAPDDPRVLIRMVPVTVSCSTLLKRFKNAAGHTLYSFGEELDTLRKTNGAGSWSSKYDIYRLAFDRGEWGQDYNSDAAESGTAKVAYNWTMLGTNGAMRKCFRQDNIENGLSSRILVAAMPDSSFTKMPKFGRRSAEDEARIDEAVTRLRGYAGFVDTPRLRKAIEQWVEAKRVEAAKDIDHVKDTYRKRSAVIGFRCGVLFRLLEGKETKACIDFALTMADYCLEQQTAAFGEVLRTEYVSAQNECQRHGANHTVFDQLAPTFSRDDLRALKPGTTDSGLRNIIMRWKQDGWIAPVDRHHWQKASHCPIVPSSH
ncbi:MAG: DUF3987 domain-containing protein [Prevotella sp.]|nr:DUF3987 domain-containing protein [Prevotella sp.]